MGHLDYRRTYHRNLPHIQPRGATFFITFRLAGSLPQSVIGQWNREREWLDHLARKNSKHYDQVKKEFERAWFRKFESILDGETIGPLWLKDKRVADTVAESLHYRHQKVYRLDAFTIMPNHVHTVFRPLPLLNLEPLHPDPEGENQLQHDDVEYHSLAAILQSLKGYTAHEANGILGRQGEFWAHESYDHWIRDNDEWQRIVAYVLNNPLKAGYVNHWQDWKWNYRRL